MRRPLIIGNWKMNKTPAESVVLSQGISNRYDRAWDAVGPMLLRSADEFVHEAHDRMQRCGLHQALVFMQSRMCARHHVGRGRNI